MAYRRKQPFSRASTFSFSSSEDFRSTFSASSSEDFRSTFASSTEDFRSIHDDSSPSSLAAQAIRASSARRDSSLSSAYGESAYRDSTRQRSPSRQDNSTTYEYTSMKSLNESKYGFWGVLARKAKSILEDDDVAKQFEAHNKATRSQTLEMPTDGQYHESNRSPEGSQKSGNPKLQKGLEAITSSLNYIGGTIGNALEEGLTIVENRTADIISETRKLQMRKKGATGDNFQHHQATDLSSQRQPQMVMQADQETQLKASRDVANAMSTRAKLYMRELKTLKADLAFAKARCAQLEEENKMLRESHEKGDTPEDDDLIRLQLETLLAEKARLANENSIYARENRFLREIIEYHQLTMQDVVYVDEEHEEVSEVYPIPMPPVAVEVRPKGTIAVDVCPIVPTAPPGVEVPSPAPITPPAVELPSPAASSSGASPSHRDQESWPISTAPSPPATDTALSHGTSSSSMATSPMREDLKRQNSTTSA
ncbi:hypothetical protein H6P81_014702 [Aristolochia fimbriata]|uniref:Uncharacterized protein n=1 Tax=Aristolochia fimbriata TaxID=158543 RepID=A0AAV7E3F7_ARIFI|nr:hypothetical protein H6P81_014702 [Aristolochia fimbriata]